MLSRVIPRIASTSASRLAPRSLLHTRVPLDYPLEAGVGKFLSPTALKEVAVDWQEGLLNKLNSLTRGKYSPPSRWLGLPRAGDVLRPGWTFC